MTSAAPLPQRVHAVDVFRGATIALMILVNNPGSWSHVYAPLRHAEWHGCTPTDLVFPFFLFIVGVAIPLALRRRVAEGTPNGPIVRKIVRRAVLLFAVGVFLNAFPFVTDFASMEWRDWSTLRIPGVLQRIAVCYLVAALLFLRGSPRTMAMTLLALLFGYWMLMTLVPLPDGPASLDDKSNNLAAVLDRTVFGTHVWQSAKTWDPEGLLSTLPAIATTLFGVRTGEVLLGNDPAGRKIRTMCLRGVALTLIGLIWNEFFPINKNLWTSSYAVFTAGLAMLALAGCLWAVDVRGMHRTTFPFRVYGLNALAVFVLSGLLGRLLGAIRWQDTSGAVVTLKQSIYRAGYTSWIGDPYQASVLFACTWIAGFFVLLFVFYRRGIVIKL